MVNEMERVAYSTTKIDKPMWEQEENGSSQAGHTVEIPEDLVNKLPLFATCLIDSSSMLKEIFIF
jgi:hypothetical protein